MDNVNAKKANYIRRFNGFLLIGFALLLFGGNAFAGQLKFSWKASKSRNVGGYKILYGLSRKNYIASIDVGKRTTYKVSRLMDGGTYYFALKAYNKARNKESKFSNEVKATVTGVTVDFTPSITSGAAPLIVTFTPRTLGVVKRWQWKFGSNSLPTAKSKIPTVTFLRGGTYTVSLTATGSNGRAFTKKKRIVVYPPQAQAQVQAFGTIQPKVSVTAPMQALVAAFSFEEDSGKIVKDNSGQGNHGVINEAVRFKEGRYGNGMKFDGVNDWITVQDSESLQLSGGYTLEAWVNPGSIRRSTVMAKEQPQGTVYDLYAYEDRDLPFSSFNDGFDYNPIPGQEPLPTEKWTHLAATFDGASQRLYINGNLVRTAQAQNQLIKPSNGVLRIGGNGVWGDFFQGYIDEVRIYNRALSDGEIQRDLRTAISPPRL